MTGKSWGVGLKAKGKKFDNYRLARPAKVELRRLALDAVGRERANVLECFAGLGNMYRAVWADAKGAIGCDLKWAQDDRVSYVADNRRLLRCLDLSAFNVFDLDAYGSPWEQATIIAARRRVADGERIALVLTDGSMMRARFGRIEGAFAALAGVRSDLPGAAREWTDLTRAALHTVAARMGGRLAALYVVDAGKRSTTYSAAVIEGQAAA